MIDLTKADLQVSIAFQVRNIESKIITGVCVC